MLALQINNQWAVLDQDQSVTIEENSPVWGEGNTFSLPFELDVEANRHILGNSDQITGMSVYDVLEGQPATLYVMGIPLFYGKLSLEDEVEIADGTVEVSLISSTLAFNDMIDGMNCQDVELKDRIVLGERWSEFSVRVKHKDGDPEVSNAIEGLFPSFFMKMRDGNKSTVNLSVAYPNAPYCNTRICYQLPEELQENEKGPHLSRVYGNYDNYATPAVNEVISGKYVVLDAERPNSAPCFYVLYFLECLFYKLGIAFDEKFPSITEQEEDMNRLAFMTTRCAYEEELTDSSIELQMGPENFWEMLWMEQGNYNYPILFSKITNKEGGVTYWDYYAYLTAPVKRCIATSKNFPNTDVSSVIDAMCAGFGMRFLFNRQQSKVTPIYVRSVLRDENVISVSAEIIDAYKQESAIRGFVLKYDGDDEDTSFNYNEWDSPHIVSSYNKVTASVNAYNKTLYVDSRNGNAYRIKNDSEATDEENQNPALFEVGMYNAVKYGDCSDENRIEEVSIPFSPIVVNDTAVAERLDLLNTRTRDGEEITDEENNEQKFAAFLDVAMKYPSLRPEIKVGAYVNTERDKLERFELSYTYVDTQRYDEKYTDQSLRKIDENRKKHRSKFGTPTAQKFLDNESPIQTYDAGLTLGVMRGPGNTSGVQLYDQDYDGEGNSKYVYVPTNYAFHSDTVDNYARVFDYDGEGNYTGVDTSGRFSLKLRAEKPTSTVAENEVSEWPEDYHSITQPSAQRRGLFDKFYTEYAHFVTHRKIAKLTLRMEIADLVNIDWTKRYRIGDFIGFINHYSYTVSASGISEVQMELYYI